MTLLQTQLPLPNRRQGKVRDVYDLDLPDGTPALVIVASDRISAFDVVMPNGIPGKGAVLTKISTFWFELIDARRAAGDATLPRHHLLSTDPAIIPGLTDAQRRELVGRVMIGRRTRVLPIECVVRGYLAGSGWAEYKASRSVCGVKLPEGLRQCDRLPEPIFTPATKEATGHDINIPYGRAAEIIGEPAARAIRDFSLALYRMARDYAGKRGILIADTKFEFGVPVDKAGNPLPGATPILIDEALTPDSSRFWPADQYAPGRDQPSFDKQFVRNHLESLVAAGRWDKTPPGPTLPDDVVKGTLARYEDAYTRLTGR